MTDAPLILLVDPSDTFRELLGIWLERNGYAVAATGNAAEALVLARSRRPDLIVGEHPLELPDGATLCRTLLDDAATRDIPFIALTAHAMPEEVSDAGACHHAGVAVKPVHLGTILELVGRHCAPAAVPVG